MSFGRYSQDIFNSAARLGVLKPDPEFFVRVEQLLERPQQQPTFFDDRQDVVEAARAAGWDAHQFNEPSDILKSQRVVALLAGDGSAHSA